MLGLGACWAAAVHLFQLITLSPFGEYDAPQRPLALTTPKVQLADPDYPVFEPPNAPEHREFLCKYPDLPEYESCSEHDNRGCWLRPKDPKSKLPEYNIFTDYENIYPKGIKRKYHLTASNLTLWADGCENNKTKVFNERYPGPWIEACWGDDIEVTVTNDLDCNGTTVHWHGIRQLNNVEHDGVNAVTQCPIAPGHSYTYKFKAMQYGTTWYHSHYSLQYADGLLGPLTIHGPSSGNYDASIDPILMTDWNHRSAFEDWAWSLTNGRPKMTSILLNGKGKYQGDPSNCYNPKPSKLHSIHFQKGVRYLLRLINTSVDTTFIFSIDGHNITVIGSDFVPIEPYTNTSVLIGIGQRYHVVVEANPDVVQPDGNYWMRTVPAKTCSSFSGGVETRTGILRYDPLSTTDPTSNQNVFDTKCSDETYSSLKPILEWQIPETTFTSELEVQLWNTTDTKPYYPDNILRWELRKGPLWLNFSAPTILHPIEDPSIFASELAVETKPSSKDQWIELLISATDLSHVPNKPGIFAPVAHPIHLHGHDFALLAQSEQPYRDGAPVKRDNPPRRDVALLPSGGYLIIAFKVDNPGTWLMHCHIAWHASSGLAMQILENTDRMVIHDRKALEETCSQWDSWYAGDRLKQCSSWHPFQDDSGI